MGLLSKEIQTFDDLLLHGLQDIYYAEQEIVKALPKLIEKATNRDLTKGLKDHLEETKNQITRLDQAFKKLGQTPKGIRCPGIDGLITEGDEIAGEVADKEVLDAATDGAAQSVEHYEIVRYGTLIVWAAMTISCASSPRTSTKRRLPIRSSRPLRYAKVWTGKPQARAVPEPRARI